MSTKTNSNQKAGKKPSFVSAPPKQPAKKESKPFSISPKVLRLLPVLSIIIFVAVAAFFLISENSDTLFMAQSRSRFLFGETFWHECCKKPGSILFWMGAYLTQFFYEPTVGASILIALWVVIFLVAKFTFKVRNEWSALILIPITALLVSTIYTGYWLYYVKYNGYWFAPSLGILVSLLITWCAQTKWTLFPVVILSALGYGFIGTFGLLPLLYIPIYEWIKGKQSKTILSILSILSVVLLIAVPSISNNQFYHNLRMDEMWTVNIPEFASDLVRNSSKRIPFFVAVLSPILFIFVSKNVKFSKAKGIVSAIAVVASLVVFALTYYVPSNMNFDNYNYHAEMRMYRAIDEERWDDALEDMANIPGDATRQMVLFKNIALFNTGKVGDQMFKYNNMGEPPYAPDSLKVHMSQLAAPLIYMHHGKINFATRWCMENSVEFGFNIDNLKILAQCALITQEWDLAQRYLDCLKQTIYYKEWAEKYEKVVKNPSLMKECHEFDHINTIYSHMGSVLDGDAGLCEMYIINYFANTMNVDSPELEEMTLAYALVQKDIQLFWPRFFLYASMHKGEPMPIHYQEAAFLYGNLEPQSADISHMPFDKIVKDTYLNFQQVSQSLLRTGMDTKAVGESMKASFGNTFYWFYFFTRDIHSY